MGLAALTGWLRRRPSGEGVTNSVTPNPLAANIDAALETRRRARAARAAAADAGHAARKAQRLPDPVVSAWRN